MKNDKLKELISEKFEKIKENIISKVNLYH
jgi:hypothetical protein